MGSRIERIERESLLRVCFMPDSLPFAFVNADNELAGFDVAMANMLAEALRVELSFVRIQRDRLVGHLEGGTCDIAMSGFAVTANRTREFTLSDVYLMTTFAFVMKDHRRREFASWEALRSQPLRIGVPSLRHFMDLIGQKLPRSELVPIESVRPFYRGDHPDMDAIAYAAEAASAWTLIYPSYSVVVPEPGLIKVPLAYPMPLGAVNLARYVNAWITLEDSSGTVARLFDLWILGRAAEEREPRWSVLHNVLGWGDETRE